MDEPAVIPTPKQLLLLSGLAAIVSFSLNHLSAFPATNSATPPCVPEVSSMTFVRGSRIFFMNSRLFCAVVSELVTSPIREKMRLGGGSIFH